MKEFRIITYLTMALLICVMTIFARKEAEKIKVNPEEEIRTIPTVQIDIPSFEEKEADEDQFIIYDVDLSEDIQKHIFTECEGKGICPEMVIAMIERESRCDSAQVGDNGKSKGLMQIQERWHKARMERLGCSDLLNPYENITVGIDYLTELQGNNPDITWVLMAYNGGPAYANKNSKLGKVSEYAESILKRTEELKGNGENNGF